MAPPNKLPKMSVGQRYGHLTVTEQLERGIRGYMRWRLKCDCGNDHTAYANALRTGRTKSCGCMRAGHKELMWKANRTHGMTRTPEYRSWNKMLDRCRNKNTERYSDYGGRGISVCERWLKFENFYADMGDRPTGTSLDRYPNNDGNYEFGNCRWATAKEQANNRRT